MTTQTEHIIENKVAKSGLVTIDLEKLAGDVRIHEFDLKDFLYMELVLREKDFREALQNYDWAACKDAVLAVHCSVDSIIASWAYMLVTSHAKPFAKAVFLSTPAQAHEKWYEMQLQKHDWAQYKGRRVLLKGCSDKSIPPAAYSIATERLLSHADRIMYGEACSFVPVWRSAKG